MRLKFLFFPIMLIISVIVFINYVWPEIENVQRVNQERSANNAALNAIKDKQETIESIGAQVAGDSAGEAAVNSYLPDRKVEERILSSVNYVAAGAVVSLVNISLKNVESPVVNSQASQGILANVIQGVNAMKTGEISNGANPTNDLANGQSSTGNADMLRYTEADIFINGDYQKVRIFLDNLQKIPLFNSIKSLAISKKTADVDDKDAGSSSAISAKVVVDFGYLSKLKMDNQKISQLSSQLDGETIDVLKKYISSQSQISMNESVSKGKSNPFLP